MSLRMRLLVRRVYPPPITQTLIVMMRSSTGRCKLVEILDQGVRFIPLIGSCRRWSYHSDDAKCLDDFLFENMANQGLEQSRPLKYANSFITVPVCRKCPLVPDCQYRYCMSLQNGIHQKQDTATAANAASSTSKVSQIAHSSLLASPTCADVFASPPAATL